MVAARYASARVSRPLRGAGVADINTGEKSNGGIHKKGEEHCWQAEYSAIK
jgi:hypothetical protein